MRSILIAEDEETKKPHFEEAEEAAERLEEVLKKSSSEGKAFFGGDTIGFIDIGFGSFLSWTRAIEKISGRKLLDETKHPSLVQWAETFAVHPAVNALLPEIDNLIEYSKILKLKLAAAK